MSSINLGITGLRRAKRWRQEAASEVFPTDSAWEWFRRLHHRELVESGALIPGRGQRGDLVGPEIDEVVITILRREAVR